VALTASPKTMLVVVDMQSGEVLKRVENPPHSLMVHCLAFSRDGDRLYAAMQEGGLAIFDGKSFKYLGAIPVPPGRWTGLQITRDEKTAYLTEMDTGKVHKVDLAAKKSVASWDVALANGLALSPDEKRLYVTTFGFLGHAPYKIVMLDARTGKLLKGADYIHPAPYGRAISDITTILFSPDGKTRYLPSVDGDGLLLADAETLEAKGFILLSAIADYLPFRMVLSPQGR
jgi:DNA-binding beta-propeller fold protein YncE